MAEVETKPTEPAPANHSVQLGIGTLIIIALIVTMCSGRGEMEKLQRDTAKLKQQLEVIDKKLDTLVQKDSATASPNVEPPAAPADAAGRPSQTP